MPDFSLFERISIHRAPNFFHCGANWSVDILFEDYDLWIILEGEGDIRVGQKKFVLAPGHAFVFAPDMHVTGSHNPANPLKVFAVHFDPFFSRGRDARLFFADCLGVDLRDFAQTVRWCRQSWDAYNSQSVTGIKQTELLLMVILCQVWEDAHGPPISEADRKLLHLFSEIRTQPEKDWSLTKMCSISALSSTYLNQRFRAMVGTSPIQFVILARTERAKILLEESSMSLGEISDSLGYRDVYFFNRQFSKTAGLTPGNYRKLNGKSKYRSRQKPESLFPNRME